MLVEAVEIIRGTVTYRGKHFYVESAKGWDLPNSPPPIGVAVSGPRSCRIAGRLLMVSFAFLVPPICPPRQTSACPASVSAGESGFHTHTHTSTATHPNEQSTITLFRARSRRASS